MKPGRHGCRSERMSVFRKVAESVPVDRVARRVTRPGVRFDEPPLRQGESEFPPHLWPWSGRQRHDLTDTRCGLLSVVGYSGTSDSDGSELWVAKCSCGVYVHRSRGALKRREWDACSRCMAKGLGPGSKQLAKPNKTPKDARPRAIDERLRPHRRRPKTTLTQEEIGALEHTESTMPWPTAKWTGKTEHDLTGTRRGSLTVTGYADESQWRSAAGLPPKPKRQNKKGALWVTRCDCGIYAVRRTKSIKSPGHDSCSRCDVDQAKEPAGPQGPIEGQVLSVKFHVSTHAMERATLRLGAAPSLRWWSAIIERGAQGRLRSRKYRRQGKTGALEWVVGALSVDDVEIDLIVCVKATWGSCGLRRVIVKTIWVDGYDDPPT